MAEPAPSLYQGPLWAMLRHADALRCWWQGAECLEVLVAPFVAAGSWLCEGAWYAVEPRANSLDLAWGISPRLLLSRVRQSSGTAQVKVARRRLHRWRRKLAGSPLEEAQRQARHAKMRSSASLSC